MKKIAIVTLYDDMNFGNKLQNLAVQIYFENMGFEVKTLPYLEVLYARCSFKSFTHGIAHKILQTFGFEKERLRQKKLKEKRRKCIKEFSDKYLKLADYIRYSRLPNDLKSQYDYFVSGSDQVWTSGYRDKKSLEYFFLMFADPEQRLTISPSFGFNEFPQEYADIYEKGLNGFKYLSCREESGQKLINKLTGKTAEIHLDPTMLINTEYWYEIIDKPSSFFDGDYIFVYALGGFSGELKNRTEKAAQKNKLKIININEINSEYYTTTRPDNFLYWIKNAKLVVTDSFHAIVFSILFKVPFIVFLRKDISGMENRLTTILNKFLLADRQIFEDDAEDFFENTKKLFSIDYSHTEKILENEREKALDFYKKCFEEYE